MNPSRKAYFDSLTDRTIVALLMANDPEAVDYVFFHRCNAMFEHIVHSVFNSQVTANELITEFYLYLSENGWERLKIYEFKSRLNTWLTVVSVRFFKKRRFFQTKTVPTDPLLMAETRKSEVDDFNVLDELSRVELYQAIDRLSKPRERYALLCDLNGKSTEEIAADMGCTVSAVYNLTKRARMELKAMFNEKNA